MGKRVSWLEWGTLSRQKIKGKKEVKIIITISATKTRKNVTENQVFFPPSCFSPECLARLRVHFSVKQNSQIWPGWSWVNLSMNQNEQRLYKYHHLLFRYFVTSFFFFFLTTTTTTTRPLPWAPLVFWGYNIWFVIYTYVRLWEQAGRSWECTF
jgi:hypothetical protein